MILPEMLGIKYMFGKGRGWDIRGEVGKRLLDLLGSGRRLVR